MSDSSARPKNAMLNGGLLSLGRPGSGASLNEDTPERLLLRRIEERSAKADNPSRAIKDQCCNGLESSFGSLQSGGATLCGALTNLVAKDEREGTVETSRHPGNAAFPQLRIARHPSHEEKSGLHGVSPHQEKRDSAPPPLSNCEGWTCPHSEMRRLGSVRRARCCVIAMAFLLGAVASRGELSKSERNDLFSQGKDFFRQANEASASDSERATELYGKSALRFERIARDGGVRNGKLFYNIGNAYFRMNDIGRAILNYRRAEHYVPNDPNLQQNLQYARERRKDKIEEHQQTRVLKTLFFWHYDFPTQVRARMFGIVFSLVWLGAGARLFVSKAGLQWFIGISAFISALLLASLLIESAYRRGTRSGVVIDAEVTARKGDSDTYEPSFTDPLHAGTEFIVVEDRGNWFQVGLADSRRCWLPLKAVELVR